MENIPFNLEQSIIKDYDDMLNDVVKVLQKYNIDSKTKLIEIIAYVDKIRRLNSVGIIQMKD